MSSKDMCQNWTPYLDPSEVVREDPGRIRDREMTIEQAEREIESLAEELDRKGRPIWCISGSLQDGFVEVTHRRPKNRKSPVRFYTRKRLDHIGC